MSPIDSASSSKRNSARLDLLVTMLKTSELRQKQFPDHSPRDSLSPLDDRTKDLLPEIGSSDTNNELLHGEVSPIGKTFRFSLRPHLYQKVAAEIFAQPEASTRETQTEQRSDFTFHDSQAKHEVGPVSPLPSTEACSPRCSPPLITRSHRPSNLTLAQTNGFTTSAANQLKQQICNGGTADSCTAITQQAPPPRLRRYRKTPILHIDMGNSSSNLAGGPEPTGDNASMRSVVRKPARILRKSSTNLFKRMDSKSPLPAELTFTAITVQQQASPTTFDGSNENNVSPIDPLMDGKSLPNSPDSAPIHSASTATITDGNGCRPLSASTTIRDSRTNDSRRESRIETHTSFIEEFTPDPECENKQLRQAPSKRDSAMSPSIPAPSPLPEDSPHKYGLKDRMDTPEVEEPEELNVVKARRRSSGLDVFNEAKSLQSASSFLNGLSTSRRRAEFTNRSSDTNGWTTETSYDTTRPSSSRLPSRPTSTKPTTVASSERRRGHTFKPSGFAYTRPLTIVQLKCYRNHVRLLPSRNKTAPVECSVCHIDDDQEHFSCSWCALRMCRFCRTDLAERGVTALKERIKQAELGGSSPASSTESLERRGRRSYI